MCVFKGSWMTMDVYAFVLIFTCHEALSASSGAANCLPCWLGPRLPGSKFHVLHNLVAMLSKNMFGICFAPCMDIYIYNMLYYMILLYIYILCVQMKECCSFRFGEFDLEQVLAIPGSRRRRWHTWECIGCFCGWLFG